MTEIPAPAPERRSASMFAGLSVTSLIAMAALGGILVTAAAIAILAPEVAGREGMLLLFGLGVLGLLLLVGVIAGERATRLLTPGGVDAAERDAHHAVAASAFAIIPDACLIVDRQGSPLTANEAYRALAMHAGAEGESGRPPGFEHIFGGHPSVSAAIFRMARASRHAQPWAEALPPLTVGGAAQPVGFDLSVTPLPDGRALWRASRREGVGAGSPALDDPMLEQAPIGFFSARPNGEIVYANAALRGWLGISEPQDALHLNDLIGEDAALVLGRGRQGGGIPVRTEVTLTTRSGVSTPATIVTSWPSGEGEATSRSVVFGATNTGAPPALARQSGVPAVSSAPAGSLLETVFANAPLGIARLDTGDLMTAVLEDANPALLDLTAGKASPGTRFTGLFTFKDDAERARLQKVDLLASEPLELTLAGHERGGEVHVYFSPDRAGRVAAFIIDAAQHKEVERQLFQSQKLQAIGQLAGGIAHDMNNFLQVIRSNTELLLATHAVGDPDFPLLNKILQSTVGGAGLIKQLLAFSRRQTVRPQVLDLSERISDIGVMLRQLLDDSIRFETRHGRDLPFIKMDKTQLDTMVMNLATNARDAMRPKGGKLTIRTGRATHEALNGKHVDDVIEGDYALIEVTDTGCGMDGPTLEKIFEPFFTTKEAGQGTGLGLATVFGIVKQSGGQVLVDSAPGKGTTFRIYIPAYEPTAEELDHMRAAERAAIEKEEKPADLAGTGRILLVEDNDGVRQAAAMALTRAGYEVIQAADGEEALEWLEDNPESIDLMVSDVMMPGMDGPTLLKEARELLGPARVIFMSGFAEDEFSQTLSREREVSFLPKPFAVPELAQKVKEMMKA